MAVSVFMSVVAMLVFNYEFLPPVGNLTISDPQNWVALGAFLLTSIVGSQLSARIQREADEAHNRRREIERLYKFSQKLLGEGNVIQLMNAIPNYIVESFEAGAAELFLPQKEKFYRSGYGAAHLDEEKMKTAFLRDEMTIESSQSIYFVPVRLGVRAIGSLGISGARLSRRTLDAVGSLVAIAIERAGDSRESGPRSSTCGGRSRPRPGHLGEAHRQCQSVFTEGAANHHHRRTDRGFRNDQRG